MPATKRRSPGVGHNSGAAEAKPGDVRFALAMETLDKEAIAELTERRKRHRKAAEGKGIVMEDLDRLYKMRDMNPTEVVIWFRRQWSTLGAFFTDLGAQFDLFAPKAGSSEERAAFRHHGMMAGLKGDDATPPPNLAGDEIQQWTEGFNEGAGHRAEANQIRLQEIADALENANRGKTTDMTPAAVAARDQARKDFQEDNPGDTVQEGLPPAGTRYFLATEPPFPTGRRSVYVDGKTVDTVDNDGSLPVYAQHVDPETADKPYTGPLVGDDFESTPEELANQAERQRVQERQAAEQPDPAEVAAAAKKLEESGFTKGAKGKGGGDIKPAGRKAKAGA